MTDYSKLVERAREVRKNNPFAGHADLCEELAAAIVELERNLLIQTESAKCLGRLVAEKDADRIFFRDKAEAAESALAEARKAAPAEPVLEKIVKWAIEKGFSTGHADTVDDLLRELSEQVSSHPAALDRTPGPLDQRLYDLCYCFQVMVSEHNGNATHGQGKPQRLPTKEQYKEWRETLYREQKEVAEVITGSASKESAAKA